MSISADISALNKPLSRTVEKQDPSAPRSLFIIVFSYNTYYMIWNI